jgi:hypothetical protein
MSFVIHAERTIGKIEVVLEARRFLIKVSQGEQARALVPSSCGRRRKPFQPSFGGLSSFLLGCQTALRVPIKVYALNPDGR